MTGSWALLKKDFASYFRSWVGVLTLFGFLIMSGIFFTLFVLGYGQLSLEAARQAYEGIGDITLTGFIMGAFLLNLGVLLLFLVPFLSMRSLAEEKRSGTLELLYTYPLTDFEIVLGKYLSLLTQLFLLFLPTLTYVLVVKFLKAKVDWGIIAGGSLGFILLGASFLSLGLFFSSLTENQIIASGLTFTSLMLLWMLEWLVGFLPPVWSTRLGGLAPFAHFRDFPLGIVDLTDVSYFLCSIVFFFFLTLRVVESRNWKA